MVAELLMRLAQGGVDFVKTEHLFNFDGKPGYSLGPRASDACDVTRGPGGRVWRARPAPVLAASACAATAQELRFIRGSNEKRTFATGLTLPLRVTA
jgi:hypothetical protein